MYARTDVQSNDTCRVIELVPNWTAFTVPTRIYQTVLEFGLKMQGREEILLNMVAADYELGCEFLRSLWSFAISNFD